MFPMRFEPNFYIDFFLVVLSEGREGEVWGPSKKRGCFLCGGTLGRKVCHASAVTRLIGT